MNGDTGLRFGKYCEEERIDHKKLRRQLRLSNISSKYLDMSIRFNPHEAKEDRFAQGISAVFLLLLAFVFFTYSTHDSGLKFLFLSAFGENADSKILSITKLEENDKFGLSKVLIFKDNEYIGEVSEVIMRSTDKNGNVFDSSFFIADSRVNFEEGDLTNIVYLESNKEIFIPGVFLDHFRIDAYVFLICLLGIFVCVSVGGVIAWRWRRFRSAKHLY